MTFEEMKEGDRASFTKVITLKDTREFAESTGDYNPIHIDEEAGKKSRFGKCIAHGGLIVGMFSTALGIGYVGNGAVYLKQSVNFSSPAYIDESVTVNIEVTEKLSSNRVRFKTWAVDHNGKQLADGEAMVMVP